MSKKLILEKLEKIAFKNETLFLNRGKLEIKTIDVLFLLVDNETIEKTAKVLNISRKTLERILGEYVPELSKSKGQKAKFRVLSLVELKACTTCKKCLSLYRKDYRAANYEKVRNYENTSRQKDSTKALRASAEASRKAAKLNATPKWFDEEYDSFVLKEMHDLCKQREKELGFKWHVDHIIPLKSKSVCGLHYHKNWQVIPAHENLAKGNKIMENI